MRAAAVVALLLHALPGAYGVAATTFVRVPEGLAYAEAEARCTQIGAAIASIHSAAENELARTACGDLTSCWLGLVETGGDAGTAAANQTWLWQDPPAGQTALPAYTNWAAGAPDNAGGVDQRNAGIRGTTGEWYTVDAEQRVDGAVTSIILNKPLCRVAGELNFTLDHAPQQCQVNTKCRQKKKTSKGKTGNVPRKDRDPTCCGRGAETENIKHRSCAPVRNQTYQLVQTGEACDVGEYAYAYKKYKCYPCKPGKTCDMGPGDKEGCWWPCGGGCIAVIIILFVILPLCCICCSVAACCFAVQQNNRQPAARIQQQPVAYAAARPAGGAYAPGQPVYGGAVQMQQYGKQPYAAQPTIVQPTVVQPTVVQPTVVQPTVVQPTVVQGAVVTGTVVQGEIHREY